MVRNSFSATASIAYALRRWQSWTRYWQRCELALESTRSSIPYPPITGMVCDERTRTNDTPSAWPSGNSQGGATGRLPSWSGYHKQWWELCGGKCQELTVVSAGLGLTEGIEDC